MLKEILKKYIQLLIDQRLAIYLIQFSKDEDSGHRILRDPAGNVRKSHRIPQESTGSGSSIPAGTFSREFLRVPCAFLWETVGNQRSFSR